MESPQGVMLEVAVVMTVLIRMLMVGERCAACKRIHGYRKSRPEERQNGRFQRLFEVRVCATCEAPTVTETWPVWMDFPVV